jgi:hypothetical protein
MAHMTKDPVSPQSSSFEAYLAKPEMRLLVACCRVALEVAGDGELNEALARPFDEAVFTKICDDHRLVVLVHSVLIRPRRDRFSPETVARFEREAQQLGLTHLRMSKSVTDVHREFASRGVRHLFLKGPVLNRQLFRGEFLRYSGDLDVLIHRMDFAAADGGLRGLGFRPWLHWWQRLLGLPLRATHRKDVTYGSEAAGHVIELHWKTDLVETFLDGFDWDMGTARCEFHGAQIPVLADPYNALYLSLHAAKHHWSRFRWLLDVSLFLRNRNVPIADVLELARRHGLETIVEEALYLSRRVFGVDCASGMTLPHAWSGASATPSTSTS